MQRYCWLSYCRPFYVKTIKQNIQIFLVPSISYSIYCFDYAATLNLLFYYIFSYQRLINNRTVSSVLLYIFLSTVNRIVSANKQATVISILNN